MGNIRLVAPSVEFEVSFFQAMGEFEADGIPQVSNSLTPRDFPAYVQRLLDLAMGKNLKDGYIPSKEYWMIDENGYAGRIILSLTFAPGPDRVGHHVGYAVRPSARRKGYATEALRLLIEGARKLNIQKLMPICDPDNVASRKVIERNGGVLLDHISGERASDGALRFLIDLGPESLHSDR